MNEDLIRDAEWSHLMHPADALALEKLRRNQTLWTVGAFTFCSITMAGVTVLAVWFLLQTRLSVFS